MVQVVFDGALLDAPRILRVRFRKIGALQYISHLDLVRTMTRVMVRAHLPIRYTSGFHPIPHLVFSAPLPVGAQSPREFVDVEVLREVNPADVIEALNNGLPDELRVDAVYYPSTKLRDVASAVYEIAIHAENATKELADTCHAALQARPIMVFKRTKAGERDVDISQAILGASAVYQEKEGDILLSIHLRAEGGSFLNPDYIVQYIREKTGILSHTLAQEWYTVIRSHLYDREGRDFS